MHRYLSLLGLLIVTSGCSTPLPSTNVLAPFGSQRVPPPPTGTVSAGSGYYSTPAQSRSESSNAGAGTRIAAGNGGSTANPPNNDRGWVNSRERDADAPAADAASSPVTIRSSRSSTPATNARPSEPPMKILSAPEPPPPGQSSRFRPPNGQVAVTSSDSRSVEMTTLPRPSGIRVATPAAPGNTLRGFSDRVSSNGWVAQ